jgi:hypothetical protein
MENSWRSDSKKRLSKLTMSFILETFFFCQGPATTTGGGTSPASVTSAPSVSALAIPATIRTTPTIYAPGRWLALQQQLQIARLQAASLSFALSLRKPDCLAAASANFCFSWPSNLSLDSSQSHRRALPAGPEPLTSLILLLAYRSRLLTSAFIVTGVRPLPSHCLLIISDVKVLSAELPRHPSHPPRCSPPPPRPS